MKKVERLEDMSVRGRMRITQQDDSDIIVAVQSERDGLLQPGDSVEFCTIGTGGGRSPRTHAALRADGSDGRGQPGILMNILSW